MIDGITIRALIPGDIAACATIMAGSPLWHRYGVTQDSAMSRLAEGLASHGEMFVAIEGNQPHVVGFIWAVVRGAFNRSGYIPLLAVVQEQRGGGIGSRLLAKAEVRIAASCTDMFLLCSDFNQDAQRFYERQGYVQVGSLPDYVLPGVAELIYCKRL